MLAKEGIPCDCSGFARYIVYHASGGSLLLPDGSFNQADWCVADDLHQVAHYSDLSRPDVRHDPSHLFIAFLPARRTKPGHVWLVTAGLTFESYSPRGVATPPQQRRQLSLRPRLRASHLPVACPHLVRAPAPYAKAVSQASRICGILEKDRH